MKRHIIIAAILAAFSFTGMLAQQNRTQAIANAALKGWEMELRLGYNLGGTSPLPLPEEIRSIDSYNPTLGLALEANFTKWFGSEGRWGLVLGAKLENKNMETKATVKNYSMEIFGDNGERVAGNWTGGVQTSVKNAFLTFPVTAAYRVHPRTSLKFGVFLSYLMSGKFDGYVYDGYLRQGDPTGLKAVYEGDNRASYDFSDNLRRFQWGLQIGADWMALNHLKVFGDLSWGLNGAFKSDFHTITFSMYPIYLTAGAAYLF